eukprot:3627643-Pyramimonas_sp.AAC.1
MYTCIFSANLIKRPNQLDGARGATGEHEQLQLPERETRPGGCLDKVRVSNEFDCFLAVNE